MRIKGLVKAAQHNGKIGTITKSKAPGEGRVGVKLDGDKGTVLAVKRSNLDLIDDQKILSSSTSDDNLPKERTLKRDNALLREFDGSRDPDVLALYYHFNDRAFDCFNAPEYNTQMIRYYNNDISVRLVVPRKIGTNDYFLVCLQHAENEKNTLCEVAFNCGRSFAGITMLVQKRCFACNRPGAPQCQGCLCACFCSKECAEKSDVGRSHQSLCKMIDKERIAVEEETLQLL